MVLRDDQAAALARAEALERELADRERALGKRDEELERLRAELDRAREDARRERKTKPKTERSPPKPKPQPKPAKAPSNNGRKRKIPSLVLHFGGVALIVGGLGGAIFGYHACSVHYLSGAALQQVLLVPQPQPAGARLVTLARRSAGKSGGRRIDLIDANTGERLLRRVVSSQTRHLWRAGGHLWLERSRPTRFELLDLQALEVVRRWKDFVAATPALGAGLHGSVSVDGASGGPIVTTERGDRLLLEPTGRTRPWRGGPSHRPATHRSPSRYRVRLADSAELSFGHLPGSKRLVLYRKNPGERTGERIPGGDSFLHPRFLVETSNGHVVRLPGEGFVMTHRATLKRRRETTISGISPLGKTLWTVKDRRGDLRGVFKLDNLLVVAAHVYGGDSYLLAIDLRTGKVRWRYRL